LNPVFLFVLFTAASLLTGPATKVVTELMARGAVEQDEGVAKPSAVPQQQAQANAQTASQPQVQANVQTATNVAPQAPTTVRSESPIMPVLATATLSAIPATATAASLSVDPKPAAEPPARAPGPAAVTPAAVSTAPPTPQSTDRATTTSDVQPAVANADLNPSPTLLALTGDTPTRRPDGSVFLPITLQRMIGMRSEITRVEQFAATEEIAGRIVTSRDVGAMIQATQAGVIEAVGGEVPRVGMRVTAGQLLATQRPIIEAAQLVEINAKIADLKGLIDMGEQRIARLREVYLIRYRQSKIDAVEAEVDNYRRQLQIYQNMMNDRIEIRAHTSGVISRVNFVAGQIVEPQTTLFEIVDPTRLWVEAASFDPALGSDIARATAVTVDGRVLQLRFTGGGLMLQNQAVPLQFDILGEVSGLQVGKPVTVIVQRKHSDSAGIRLPRAAVLHSATGETMVWERLSAEAFIARPVNMVPLDGNDVIVTSGLTANMRIVTAASETLSQIR
jgi:cobalt-zinc-cadmium efflux system membrane fusion protein